MIHFISSCDNIGSSILTSLTLHRCFGPSVPSHHSTCPSHLQLVRRAKSCLDLLHLSHMTQCHVSCAMSSFITCVSLATIQAMSPLWHMLLTHMYLWINHLCISLKHILVHLKLSLNYQNQTKTFQCSPPQARQYN
jgi:hypothetical protein